MTLRTRIVKVGGSLFEMPELQQRLQQWLAAHDDATNLLIAGGGTLADSIRDLDRLHKIGDAPAHLLCVRAMGVTARMLVDLLNETALVDRLDNARKLMHSPQAKTAVFDPAPLLQGEEQDLSPEPLPHDWSVTSDSIAARVAEVLEADELVLLKSALPASISSLSCSEDDYVDRYFAALVSRLTAQGIPIRCVNCRDVGFEEVKVT